jgi:hypothetical protein
MEMVTACFCFAFSGLGDASAIFARGLAFGLSVVDSDAGGLEEIVVFDIHSVGSDDVDGFLQLSCMDCVRTRFCE